MTWPMKKQAFHSQSEEHDSEDRWQTACPSCYTVYQPLEMVVQQVDNIQAEE